MERPSFQQRRQERNNLFLDTYFPPYVTQHFFLKRSQEGLNFEAVRDTRLFQEPWEAEEPCWKKGGGGACVQRFPERTAHAVADRKVRGGGQESQEKKCVVAAAIGRAGFAFWHPRVPALEGDHQTSCFCATPFPPSLPSLPTPLLPLPLSLSPSTRRCLDSGRVRISTLAHSPGVYFMWVLYS